MADDIRVTDHALVRFLERVEGIDFGPLREEIASLTRAAINLGAVTTTIDGFLYRIDPRTRAVITIFTSEMRKTRSPEHIERNFRKEHE